MMNLRASFAEAFWIALASLRASKLRSFLTLLGIILSTTTLIAVMSVIHGMNRYVAEKIADWAPAASSLSGWPFSATSIPRSFSKCCARTPN